MLIEARRITFSNGDLYAALDRHLVAAGSGLPAGAITHVWGDTSHDVVMIDIASGKDKKTATLKFPATQVGEALIDYCLAKHVPLPQAFTKSLIIKPDYVALEITNAASDPTKKATNWRSIWRRTRRLPASTQVRR